MEKTLVVSGGAALAQSGQKQLCCYLDLMAETGFQIKVLVGAAAFPAKGTPYLQTF